MTNKRKEKRKKLTNSARLPTLDPTKDHHTHVCPIHRPTLVHRIKTNRLVRQTVGGTREGAHTCLRGARRARAHVLPANLGHRLASTVRRTAFRAALLCLRGDVHDDVLAAIGVLDEARGAAVAVDACVLRCFAHRTVSHGIIKSIYKKRWNSCFLHLLFPSFFFG